MLLILEKNGFSCFHRHNEHKDRNDLQLDSIVGIIPVEPEGFIVHDTVGHQIEKCISAPEEVQIV